MSGPLQTKNVVQSGTSSIDHLVMREFVSVPPRHHLATSHGVVYRAYKQTHMTQSQSSKFSRSLYFFGILDLSKLPFLPSFFCPPFWGHDTRGKRKIREEVCSTDLLASCLFVGFISICGFHVYLWASCRFIGSMS